MTRPRLLDLFCGAGGAAMGYHRAGFDVVGVDINPQPHYPFEFHQHDALTFPTDGFDAIHASPPCQGYSRLRHLPWLKGREYPMLIPPTRERLEAAVVPWVIENVYDAPLTGIWLCGTMFARELLRHRRFESSVFMLQPPHVPHRGSGHGRDAMAKRYAGHGITGVMPGRTGRHYFNKSRSLAAIGGFTPRGIDRSSVAGHISGVDDTGERRIDRARRVMGIDWMTRDELTQAIPPVMTEYVGQYLIAAVRSA